MTIHGHRAKILCFDKKGELPIVATIDFEDHEMVYDYAEDGTMPHPAPLRFTLVMRDDDYLEKLERGEYAPSVKENLTVENPTCKDSLQVENPVVKENLTTDREYWRRVYAGQAMPVIVKAVYEGTINKIRNSITIYSGAAIEALKFADALIAELEKK